MAITRTLTQITWSAASTLTISSNSEQVSDVFTVDDTCFALSIQLAADNQGTPTAGDTATWRIQWSNGDVWADTGDDYDTSEHAQLLQVMDTVAANTPGEDPVVRTIDIGRPVAKKFKLAVTCPQAATRNIKVAARVDEHRAA